LSGKYQKWEAREVSNHREFKGGGGLEVKGGRGEITDRGEMGWRKTKKRGVGEYYSLPYR